MKDLAAFEGRYARWTVTQQGKVTTAVALIGEDHPCFEGHFDQVPIFPGAAQIGLVMDVLGYRLGRRAALRAVTRSKFTAILRPGTSVTVQVELLEEASKGARWQVGDDGTIYSKGVINYE